jgi:hypothetical protein
MAGLAACTRHVSAAEQQKGTVRDRLWIWTHVAGSHNEGWNIPRLSRMTPVEGAAYLGVPNLMFVRYDGKPELPFDAYAISFRPMKQVVWSLTGAGGQTSEQEREHVLRLAGRFTNITGFIMDDFFHAGGRGSLSLEELSALRAKLQIRGQPRPLYVVVYQHQLELPIQSSLDLCDKITFWTWTADQLGNLERNFARLEQMAPRQGKLLGCYMWDYGRRRAMPVELMKKQCEFGLELLRSGRAEGMIFLASNICDLELPAVEQTRQWIAAVGGELL